MGRVKRCQEKAPLCPGWRRGSLPSGGCWHRGSPLQREPLKRHGQGLSELNLWSGRSYWNINWLDLNGCRHKSSFFTVTDIGSRVVYLQTSLSSSIIVLRLELEPSGVSLVLSQEFSVPGYTSYLPLYKLPFSAPPYTWDWGTSAPSEVHSIFICHWREKIKGLMDNPGTARTALCVLKCVALFYKKVQHTHAVLSSCLQGRKVNKGGMVPPRAPVCTESYIQLVLSYSNLSTLQLLCPCELLLQPPWICFAMSFCQNHNHYISWFDVNPDILYPNPNNMHCLYNSKGKILTLDHKCLIASD